ncbi:hypothetical protein [Pseudomonas viridiflava]|uniref:hypothetical protein n=1 Tax=Pseudomonas viridiflava TaxID=33069 RepID=UPI001C3133EE|nr:hypothetical protein [Pseudomonas viridiflava]QXG35527.1 hypothetical protein KTT61_26395 [Pseudomonas viridiflava]
MELRKVLADSAPFAIRLAWIAIIAVPSVWLAVMSLAESGVLTAATSVAAAGWFQAAGALLAIGGAAFFPYLHEDKKEKARRERIRQTLLMLAQNQREQIRLLHSSLKNAVYDFGENTINPYVDNEWPMKWPPHIEALRAIPITDINSGQVYTLTELKVAADYAWSVCCKLKSGDWNVSGDLEIRTIEKLNHYHTMAGLAEHLFSRRGRELE